MSIPETFYFDKAGQVEEPSTIKRLFLALIIALVALLAFGVGRLSGEGRRGGVEIKMEPVPGDQASQTSQAASPVLAPQSLGDVGVYASSKGTKYYFSTCKSSILAANKITFASPAQAEAAGYTLATGCHQ